MTKFTRVLTFALLAPTLFASTLAAQTEPEPPKFTIVISTEKPEVLLGSSVVIAITITNVSQREIGIGCGHHGNMPDGYQYDLRDEQGIVVPKVVYQDPLRPIRPPGNPMPGGCGIKPGKRMEERATISDEYQFGHPANTQSGCGNRRRWGLRKSLNWTESIPTPSPSPCFSGQSAATVRPCQAERDRVQENVI